MPRKARNPFLGIARAPDRHGKVRWRLRRKSPPIDTYIAGEYASAEFRANYEAAINGAKEPKPASNRFIHGSFDWLIEHYLRSPAFQKLAPITKVNRRADLERFRREYGSRSVKGLRGPHVEALVARKSATPAAANKLLKLVRLLCRFAIRKELIAHDPTVAIERYSENQDGYHTWTDDEIAQFEDHHGFGSSAVTAMRLMLFTGAARQDAAAMGWQNVKNGRISYRRQKTGQEVDLPILDELDEVLASVPADRMLFVTHGAGRPYKATTFGSWFRDRCNDAGLPQCSAHGLRKAGATRLANAGANELEIMAFLGHRTPDEARTYVKKANRRQLSDRGMARLKSAKGEQDLSNRVERLDKRRHNALKNQEK